MKLAAISTLACLLVATPAAARPGDLIVGDSDAGMVLRIDPSTGAQSVIADDFGDGNPDGIAFDKRGNILVSAYENGFGDGDAVFKISRSGAVSTLTSGAPLGQPAYLDRSPEGRVYLADPIADSLFKLSPGGGEPVPFAANVSVPFGIEVAHDASLFVSGTDGVFRVNRQSGAAVDISPGLFFPGGMTLAPNGILFMASETDDSVYRINPQARTFAPIIDESSDLNSAYDVAIHPNGFLYLANNDEAVGTIERVDPGSGDLTEIASQSDPDSFLDFPEGIEVEPPMCKGRSATIVGSDEDDRLKGSKFADVIAGIGGRDRIRGVAGNDRLCGGKGRDRLRGGPGNDKLLGQQGRDSLNGGPGTDREKQ